MVIAALLLVLLPAGATVRDCADCPELVVVPAGRYTMGFDGGEADRPEGPPRIVRLRKAFALGRYEVTHAQYAAFVRATGHESGRGCYGPLRAGETGNWSWYEDANWQHLPAGAPPPRADDPVVCVSWLDAHAYVAWLSQLTGERYRLPTEAEWEYAARAGSTMQFPWGDEEAGACAQANVYDQSGHDPARSTPFAPCDDGQPRVAVVGALAANAFGLHDMIGNVWEWTEDCYVAPYPRRPVDGSAVQVRGHCELRVVRGGSWRTLMFRQRSTWRGRDPEDRKADIFGFRIARDLR